MKAIHKYNISAGSTSVQMPQGAKILHVGGQGESICLWARVDTEQLGELRHFRVFGTGDMVPGDDEPGFESRHGERSTQYLGTAMCGEFVRHVFTVWS